MADKPPRNRITGIETDIQKNRFTIESEPVVQKKSHKKITLTLTIILFLLSLGGSAFFLYKKFGLPFSLGLKKNIINKADVSVMDDDHRRSLQPEDTDLPEDKDLTRAVKLYRSGYAKSARAQFDKILESSAPNMVKSYALVYMGIIADDQEKFNQALDYFQRAIKFYPKNYYAHYNMAMTYKHKGDVRLAREELEIAQKIRPDSADIATLKGELEFESGNYEGSEETLQNLAESTKDARAYYNLGLVYKKEGKIAEAKTVFLKAVETQGSPEAVYQSLVELGKIYAIQQDYDNAQIYMMRALKMRPENAKQYYNLAVIQYSSGNLEGARKSLDRSMEGLIEKPDYYIYIANLYKKLNDMESAEMALRKAKAMAPLHPEVMKSLADLLIEESKWTEAIDYLKKLADMNNGTLEKAQIFYQLGKAYMETGDFDNAQKSLELAYDLDNVNEDALIALGNLYHLKGESQKSIALYKKAFNINPDNVAVLKALGILYYDLHLFSEAEDTFKQLLQHPLKKDKDVYFVYNALGKIYKSKKMYENAITYFEKASMTDDVPIKFDALMEITDCSMLADKPAMSVFSNIEKAIALKPESYEARVMLVKALLKDGSAAARERAEEEIKTVLELANKPEVLSKAFTLRGIIYFKEGFYKKAIDDFNAALDYDPSNNEAFQNKGAAAKQLESNM